MSRRFLTIMRTIAETDAVINMQQKDDDRVFFEVRTGDGRSQVVMASLVQSDEGEELVLMLSEIGPASPDLYEEMLLRNLQLHYARTAIIDNNGEKNFALVYSYPFSELETIELAKAFGEIAFMADAIERDCFQVDRV